MFNKIVLYLFIAGLLLFFSAQNALAADSINAEILSKAWYSDAKINAEDIININAGNRIIQIKILNIKEVVPKTSIEKAEDIANIVVNTGNQYADNLANYVESLKMLIENYPVSAGIALKNIVNTTKILIPTQIGNQEKVLGASTENDPATKNILQKLPFYNPLLDLIIFLIHHWIWVLGGILLFLIYLKFT